MSSVSLGLDKKNEVTSRKKKKGKHQNTKAAGSLAQGCGPKAVGARRAAHDLRASGVAIFLLTQHAPTMPYHIKLHTWPGTKLSARFR